jgi:hypothetical protein
MLMLTPRVLGTFACVLWPSSFVPPTHEASGSHHRLAPEEVPSAMTGEDIFIANTVELERF